MSIPISPELLQSLASLSPTQLAWLSGYAWSNSQQQNTVSPVVLPVSGVAEPVAARKVLVLSASQTGNARRVAESLQLKLEAAGINAVLIASGDYKIKQLSSEDILLLVTSTQGEGEPPEEALPLYKYLFGKKAPDLNQLHFAVLGLGDSSYPQFCQCAKDFDAQLAHLGAQRLAERTDCDVDYQSSAAAWQDKIIALISELNNTNSANINEVQQSVVAAQTAVFTKAAPFSATLSLRQRITTPEANKDVEHIEIDLTGSGIRYQPGDALGVFYQNAATLVEEILQHTQVDRDALVRLADGREISIGEALQNELDITQNTPALVQNYARQIQNAELDEIVADSTALKQFIATTPPVSVLAAYPHLIDAQALHDLFRPLTPRLYSIASSQDEVGEEVHLTVGVVRFIQRQQQYTGGASGFLGERLPEGEAVRVFIEENHRFRLPEDGNTPIIMIGAGTGIAPFRAFMQQRDANGDAGENWLFFGNQKFTDDFLYQAEWLQYRKSGLLTRYDFAWSRQENEKVYVQHKLRERAQDIWEWLQRGAHIYVCGDAGKMARDVEQALLDIVIEQGKLSSEDADEYLSELRQQQRYQRDVY
ncbi:sulfite reductase [NADPH] flavoprotein, alpha-component [Snodgrassella alvi]|uniref:assimilatory sulfite reductase (NADPH) flavoprotein subunit n=1 Tax=Snodgrassella alvi TaxID=1196083 RepID=UPI0009FE5D5D|nr:assimilatory sulfite reductase (NADPH) flavoprotein subunit [Snodgrassella alvi]ORF05294.1 sulfite reductase [NADPH] flavoprotein, alpha-component [Snodgrassella alvi]ORF10737.1 sulfite reductase [NADPH] flavoprotein, alpha-component [Snodgrassella alvi]ORF17638.1 sulfite reductase [NADPH] flavoprotein, alpha-component [Snodgrassella alvi]ORF20195.1 sulfite reductase [NADPH] flavoprotein, alpha-component [Snodgrassella alvi]